MCGSLKGTFVGKFIKRKEVVMAKQENVVEVPVPVVGTMDKLISSILSTRRPHNSKGELSFLQWLHDYTKTLGYVPIPMASGCLAVTVGKGSKTLFSCHIDTVHSNNGLDVQNVVYDSNLGHIFVEKDADCLGADDGAGIYILLKMMEAKVEGTYLFHRGEECGGIGAHAMLAKHKEWLEGFDRCVAFDRKGTTDVVITQGSQLCASTVFGTMLAGLLDMNGLKHAISHGGTFTDCKVYRQVIPCCVNVACGYQNEHRQTEYLDWGYLQALTAVCCKLPWETLVVSRKIMPETLHVPQFSNWQNRMNRDLYSGFEQDDHKVWSPSTKQAPQVPIIQDLRDMTYEDIVDWVQGGPDEVANDIVELLLELDAEKAKVARLQVLLGL